MPEFEPSQKMIDRWAAAAEARKAARGASPTTETEPSKAAEATPAPESPTKSEFSGIEHEPIHPFATEAINTPDSSPRSGAVTIIKEPEDLPQEYLKTRIENLIGKGKSPEEAARIATNELAKARERKNVLALIGKAESFTALCGVLDRIGGLQGSKQFYPAAELKSTIELVRDGKASLQNITSTAGLRERVSYLINYERELAEKKRGREERLAADPVRKGLLAIGIPEQELGVFYKVRGGGIEGSEIFETEADCRAFLTKQGIAEHDAEISVEMTPLLLHNLGRFLVREGDDGLFGDVALFAIERDGKLSTREIENRFMITTSHAERILATLQERGFVETETVAVPTAEPAPAQEAPVEHQETESAPEAAAMEEATSRSELETRFPRIYFSLSPNDSAPADKERACRSVSSAIQNIGPENLFDMIIGIDVDREHQQLSHGVSHHNGQIFVNGFMSSQDIESFIRTNLEVARKYREEAQEARVLCDGLEKDFPGISIRTGMRGTVLQSALPAIREVIRGVGQERLKGKHVYFDQEGGSNFISGDTFFVSLAEGKTVEETVRFINEHLPPKV